MKFKGYVRRVAELFGLEIHRHPSVRRVQLIQRFDIDLVIDVGAGKGQYAMELRRRGYAGRIVSLEPLTASFNRLRQAGERDGKWITVQKALGDATGELMINVAGNGDSSSFLPMLPAHEAAAPHSSYTGVERVPMARLDDVAPAFLERSTRPLIKIDAQGYEREVLAGGGATIGQARGLQIELSFVPLYEGGPLYDEVLGVARDDGFSVVHLEPGFIDQRSGQLLQADALLMRLE